MYACFSFHYRRASFTSAIVKLPSVNATCQLWRVLLLNQHFKVDRALANAKNTCADARQTSSRRLLLQTYVSRSLSFAARRLQSLLILFSRGHSLH